MLINNTVFSALSKPQAVRGHSMLIPKINNVKKLNFGADGPNVKDIYKVIHPDRLGVKTSLDKLVQRKGSSEELIQESGTVSLFIFGDTKNFLRQEAKSDELQGREDAAAEIEALWGEQTKSAKDGHTIPKPPKK